MKYKYYNILRIQHRIMRDPMRGCNTKQPHATVQVLFKLLSREEVSNFIDQVKLSQEYYFQNSEMYKETSLFRGLNYNSLRNYYADMQNDKLMIVEVIK